MKVCLVIPGSPYLLDDRALPWLGPLYVAACLRDQGHQVRILDLAGDKDFLATAAKDAREIGADCYGLTATAPDYPLALQIREAIRTASPGVRIILGGAHASMEKSANLDGWDAVVQGDGFLAANVSMTRDGFISARYKGEILDSIEWLPFPARDLVDLDSYDFRIQGERATSFMSQLGCPMQCRFCAGRNIYSYRKLRALSPHRIIAEMDQVRSDWPIFRAAMLYDDELNIPKSRAIELSEALISHPTKWVLRGFVKGELFDDSVASAMSKAGFREVLSGIESGSDRILKLIHKNTTYEVNLRAREIAKKHGILFKASCMLGLPTETYEDVMLTKQWLLEAKPESFDVTIFSPFPGSPLYDQLGQPEVGLHIGNVKGNFAPYKSVPGGYHTTIGTDSLSPDDLMALRDEIDRDVRQHLGIEPLQGAGCEASMGQRSYASVE